MKLDHIPNINEYGDDIVRLYEFNRAEAEKFRSAIEVTVVKNKSQLALKSLDFIQERNCSLTLRISPEDTGIFTQDNEQFFCDLTLAAYAEILKLLEPFCVKETKGYQWLYDLDSQTDFLFSPGGTW